MKFNRSMLAAVAMILSAATALGCNSNKKSADEETFVDAPPAAEAPSAETPSTDTPATDEGVKVAAKIQIPAPPALRTESPGRAPSVKHRWSAGFWRYDTGRRGYAWVPGHWELRDAYAPYAPPAPRYEDRRYSPGRGYVFIVGFWSWTGREYTWIPGHYESRRAGYRYVKPRWEQAGGQWVRRDGHWAPRPANERGKHRPGSRASAPGTHGSTPSHGGHAGHAQTGNHQTGNHQTGNHQTGNQAGNHGGQAGNHQAPAPRAMPKLSEKAQPAIVKARPSLAPSSPRVTETPRPTFTPSRPSIAPSAPRVTETPKPTFTPSRPSIAPSKPSRMVEVPKPAIRETKASPLPPKPSKLVAPEKTRPTPPRAEGPKSRLQAPGRAR